MRHSGGAMEGKNSSNCARMHDNCNRSVNFHWIFCFGLPRKNSVDSLLAGKGLRVERPEAGGLALETAKECQCPAWPMASFLRNKYMGYSIQWG